MRKPHSFLVIYGFSRFLSFSRIFSGDYSYWNISLINCRSILYGYIDLWSAPTNLRLEAGAFLCIADFDNDILRSLHVQVPAERGEHSSQIWWAYKFSRFQLNLINYELRLSNAILSRKHNSNNLKKSSVRKILYRKTSSTHSKMSY